MSQLLESGATVQTRHGGVPCRVQQFLGGGGQGEVYRSQMGTEQVALKWYFPQQATEAQRDGLLTLIGKGAPDGRFLWPLDLVTAPDKRSFGYVMPLRGAQYRSIIDLMKRRVDPTFQALAHAGMELADSFWQLHAKGLSYRDISFGNVFFDPDTGHIAICDNDNVAVDGTELATVLGTPGFMAPEIVSREARPSSQTDLYSLAVLLFHLLLVAHPLDGLREASIRCLDLPAREKLYGREALFIFDPDNDSNRPHPDYHRNALETWPLLPQSLKDLFTRAFTVGLHQPDQRIRESEWRRAMADLRDAVFYCQACGEQNFFDETAAAPACWHCRRPLRSPLRIGIGRAQVMLNHDTRLYPHHTNPDRTYDFDEPVAELAQHPTNPNVWGLRNRSSVIWQVTLPDGQTRAVDPGRAAPLANGVVVHFGRAEGTISQGQETS